MAQSLTPSLDPVKEQRNANLAKARAAKESKAQELQALRDIEKELSEKTDMDVEIQQVKERIRQTHGKRAHRDWDDLPDPKPRRVETTGSWLDIPIRFGVNFAIGLVGLVVAHYLKQRNNPPMLQEREEGIPLEYHGPTTAAFESFV